MKEIEGWMHQVDRHQTAGVTSFCQTGARPDGLLGGEEKAVLGIPMGDTTVVPHRRADGVDDNMALFGELLNPVGRPLFVDVADATLKRNRCREQHYRRESGEILDQRASATFAEVLRDLEAAGEVEAPINRKSLLEIAGTKSVNSDLESGPIDVWAIEPEDILHMVALEDGQPTPDTASDIDDGASAG